MPRIRKHYSAEFKARVALEAVRGERTISEIASTHGVHPNQVTQWKKQVEGEASALFADKRQRDASAAAEQLAVQDRLYRQIGELTMEVDWLKKKCGPAG
jgi:transposase-like protein